MTITIKRNGAYVDSVGVYAKKNGVYAPVSGVFVKAGGQYVNASLPQRVAALLAAAGGTRRMYVRDRGVAGSSIIGLVGQMFNNNNGSAFQLFTDIDGFYSFRGARVGAAVLEAFGVARYAQNITGIGGSVATVNSYATTVGGRFTGVFSGPGFAFSHYADDRGGIWRFNIDNGARVVDISTWASPLVSSKQQMVVTDMALGQHTFVATFTGDDPLHAPTGGVSRGWFKNVTEGCILDVDESVPSAGVFGLSGSSISESAISCRPTDKAVVAEWVPSHGPAGVVKNIVRKMYLDGVDVGSGTIPTARSFTNFRIEQAYGAFNPNDTASPTKMWDGMMRHEFTANGLRVRDRKVFTASVTVGPSYLATVAGDVTVENRLRFSDGQEFAISNTTKQTDIVGTPSSAMFYRQANGIAAVGAVASLADVLTLDQLGPGASEVMFTERTDNTSKAYWRKILSAVIPAGTVWDTDTFYAVASGVDPSTLIP